MFKITKDVHFNIYYIHKKFLWFWVKYSISKTNVVASHYSILQSMKKGHYEFSRGEYANWDYLMETGYYTERYYDSINDFVEKHGEYLI